jgi:hypothetical protein
MTILYLTTSNSMKAATAMRMRHRSKLPPRLQAMGALIYFSLTTPKMTTSR